MLVVLPDVAHELFVEVFGRGEDASCDHVALDACEPVLDLVEPRRVRRRVVDLDAAMLGQERFNEVGLVTADVVADDVDLQARLSRPCP